MTTTKKIIMSILRYLLAVFMIYAGVQHFVKPDFYRPFVPEFLIFTTFIILSSGVVEILLGGMLLLKGKLAQYGALGVFLLMLVFLPVHIKDVLVEDPAIGTTQMALIRLPVQFLFIAWSWGVYRFLKKQ
ncbi:MAG: hypothetical protein CR968_02880 [Flavobacteriia bacterium]|nr:MAG: hypothetical protein CR968_02880 [Flavobacteriia bacterium]